MDGDPKLGVAYAGIRWPWDLDMARDSGPIDACIGTSGEGAVAAVAGSAHNWVDGGQTGRGGKGGREEKGRVRKEEEERARVRARKDRKAKEMERVGEKERGGRKMWRGEEGDAAGRGGTGAWMRGGDVRVDRMTGIATTWGGGDGEDGGHERVVSMVNDATSGRCAVKDSAER
ncbi:hypothetical protein DFH09DRAFT_1287887 [Mycena vulgaris]|nr:hypothetical protein DFH09DRAFT_1287887 [Mycena vulgaris]